MARARNQSDEITHYVFDTQTMPIAGATLLTFFQQTLSAGVGLTNMRTAGRFPSPESFECKSISLGFDMSATLADVSEIYNNTGMLTLYLGKTWYIDAWPLGIIPPAIGLSGNTAATVARGSASGIAQRVLAKAIPFETDEPFRVEIRWGTAPTPVANVTIQVILGGVLTRQVQ